MMRALIFVALLSCTACGGATPTAPTAPSTPPPPAPLTITGTLTATNGGQPLSGVTLDAGVAHTTTSDAGAYSLSVPASAPTLTISLSRAGLIDRRTYVAPGTRTVNLDAIADGGGFDLNFYRQFVRDAFDTPTTLQPLRRWTRAPSIYLRTVDDAGAAVDAKTLDTTEAVIRETLPIWTADTIALGTLERGTETRVGQAGWITVLWNADRGSKTCGRSDVALSGGMIELFHRVGGNCRCAGGPELRPRTVRHELGHAMGFLHTDSTSDVMSGLSAPGCDALPSARERYHAAIAYHRPIGNSDPDSDAPGTVTLAPMRVP